MTTDTCTLAHGGGGPPARSWSSELFVPRIRQRAAAPERHDGATLPVRARRRLASPPTAYVVSPLFFPGGDIGSLAVHGTVNDLAMGGALPLCLTRRLHHRGRALPCRTLERIVAIDGARRRARPACRS